MLFDPNVCAGFAPTIIDERVCFAGHFNIKGEFQPLLQNVFTQERRWFSDVYPNTSLACV